MSNSRETIARTRRQFLAGGALLGTGLASSALGIESDGQHAAVLNSDRPDAEYELAKPENRKTFKGYVRMARPGRFPMATIQLEGVAATVVLNGPEAAGYALMDHVEVEVRGVDLIKRKLDAKIRKTARR